MSSATTHPIKTIELTSSVAFPPAVRDSRTDVLNDSAKDTSFREARSGFGELNWSSKPAPAKSRTSSNRTRAFVGLALLGSALGAVIALHPYFNSPTKSELLRTEATAATSEPAVVLYSSQASSQGTASTLEVQTGESNIVAFAQKRPVSIAPRQFLLSGSTPRSGVPTFSPAPIEPALHRMTEPKLAAVPDNQGMYKPEVGAASWQGGWALNDPASNLRRAEQFNSYLDSKVGSVFSNRLSSTIQSPSKMLPQVTGGSK